MKDFFEALAGMVLIVGLAVAYCWATPDQYSGEADWTAQAAVQTDGPVEATKKE